MRQLLLGQQFFQKQMGRRCNTFWLCDAAGLVGCCSKLRFPTWEVVWSRQAGVMARKETCDHKGVTMAINVVGKVGQEFCTPQAQE